MQKTILLFLLNLCSFLAWSQDGPIIVIGRAVDSATKQPLSGASAFCPNTSYGATATNDGYFYLKLPPGGYDLTVSYTGYERKNFRITANHIATDTLFVELAAAEKVMSEVAVVASNEVPDGFAKYGNFFLENFFGTTENAKKCVLKNPEALRFFYNKKRNRLKVLTKEDLQITNYALGYKIKYQLDSFIFEYNNNTSQFIGFALYNEIDTTEEARIQFKKNRARTYLGSRLHFMRSYYENRITEEGFMIEKLGPNPNVDQSEIIKDLYNEEFYAKDSGEVILAWKGRYRVSYKRVFPDKKFLELYKLPANTTSQITAITMLDTIVISGNGFFYDQTDMVNFGYWAWKKMAEQLPYDYYYE
ncbi:carboxypeptidase-like regulatory domain-containing protein [Paraflavitalea sp. sgz302552]|jgi:hypothetical protein|uniref:carboxypeptidase-like regulatory domain-containing protein n=1 Tax=Paraflavitalea sp. sgz302552 TaxID=3423908 RepID=UPI003D32C182